MTATTATQNSATAPGSVKNKTLWALQILLGLFFVVASALPKLVGQEDAVESFRQIGFGQWFRYLTGVVELAGGIGLVVPRLAGTAAAGLSITMVLAALTQTFLIGGPAMAIFPLALAVLFAWMAWSRRADIAAVFASLRR